MRFNGKKFQEIMRETGLSLEDVCIKTGLHITALNSILENGFASTDAMQRLADAAGRPVKELTLSEPSGSQENVIEFMRDGTRAIVSFSQGRYKTRIQKLAKLHPEECQIIAENKDGSLCAHIPVSWVHIKLPVKRTEAQREASRKNLLRMP